MEKQQNQKKQELQVLQYGDLVCIGDTDTPGFMAHDQGITDSLSVCKMFDRNGAVHALQECSFRIVQKHQYSAQKVFDKRIKGAAAMKITKENWRTKLSDTDSLFHQLSDDVAQIRDERDTNAMEARRKAGENIKYGAIIQIETRHGKKFVTQTKNRAEKENLAMEVALVHHGGEGSWWRVLPAEKIRGDGDAVMYGDKVLFENVKYDNSFLFVSWRNPITENVKTADGKGVEAVHPFLYLHPSSQARYEVCAAAVHTRMTMHPLFGYATQVAVGQVDEEAGGGSRSGQQQQEGQAARVRGAGGGALCGMDCVTILHRQSDSVLVCSSKCPRHTVCWITQDDLARSEAPDLKLDGSAAGAVVQKAERAIPRSIWRIKPRELAHAQAPLARSSALVLLQHMQTGMYLTVRDDGCVLTADVDDLGALWVVEALVSANAKVKEKGASRGGRRQGAQSQLASDFDTIGLGESVWIVHAGLHRGGTAVKGSSSGERVSSERSWLSHPHSGGGGGGGGRGNNLSRPPSTAEDELIEAIAGESGGLDEMEHPVTLVRGGQINSLDVIEPQPVTSSYADMIDFLRSTRNILDSAKRGIDLSERIDPELSEDRKYEEAMRRPFRIVADQLYPVFSRIMGTCINMMTYSREKDPILRDGAISVQNQDLIRQMGILIASAELIKALDDMGAPLASAEKKIPGLFCFVRYSYKLMEKGCDSNSKSKKLIAPYSSLMFKHIRMAIGSYFTRVTLFENYFELLTSQTMDDFTYLFNALKVMRSPKIVNFFCICCECNGQPLVVNQNLIGELVTVGDGLDLFFQTKLEGDEFMLIGSGGNISVSELVQREGEAALNETNTDPVAQAYCYHQQLMSLIGKLTLGRNSFTSQQIISNAERLGVTRQQLTALIQHPGVPYGLRARYCSLMVKLYIDVDPFVDIDMIYKSAAWGAVNKPRQPGDGRGEDEGPATDVARQHFDVDGMTKQMSEFDDLKDVLVDLFNRHKQTDCDTPSCNSFVTELVKIVQQLTRFGFYHILNPETCLTYGNFPSMSKAATSMLEILDGRTDLCAPFGGYSRDVSRLMPSSSNNIVMREKQEILKALGNFFTATQFDRLTKLQHFWERIVEQGLGITSWPQVISSMVVTARNTVSSDETEGGPAPKALKLSFAGTFRGMASQHTRVQPSNLTLGSYSNDPTRWKESPPWTEAHISELEGLLFEQGSLLSDKFSLNELENMSQRGNSWLVPEWICILLDLVRYFKTMLKEKELHPEATKSSTQVRYSDTMLKEKALSFLFASFSQKSNFIGSALKIQMIYEPALARLMYDAWAKVRMLAYFAKDLGSNNEEKRKAALSWCSNQLQEWTNLLAVTAKTPIKAVNEIQTLLTNVGVLDGIVAILFYPLKRIESTEKGTLDQADDPEMLRIFSNAYTLMGRLCDENPACQEKVMGLTVYKHLHLGMEGTSLEYTLYMVIQNNHEMVRQVGAEWVPLFFQLMSKYSVRYQPWLRVLTNLVKCRDKTVRENQALFMVNFTATQEIAGMFMKTPEEWDLRIKYMQDGEMQKMGDKSQLAFHLSSVDLLSAICEGKNPSAEVYAANYLSFQDCVKALVRLTDQSDGTRANVPFGMECRVRSSFLNFITQVFVETGVERLQSELKRKDNGLFEFDPADASWEGCMPVIELIGQNARFLAIAIKDTTGFSQDEMRMAKEFFFGTVCPFLRLYYSKRFPESSIKVPEHVQVSCDVFDAVRSIHTLLEDEVDEAEQILVYHGQAIHMSQATGEVLNIMSVKSKIRQEWSQNLRNKAVIEQRRGDIDLKQRAKDTLRLGHRMLIETLAKSLKISDTKRLIGVGLQQMAMMLYRDGEVPLYHSSVFMAIARPTPANPKYTDVVFSMLEVSRSPTTDSKVLTEILRVMRAVIYLYEPKDPERPIEESVEEWNAFLRYDPSPPKSSGPPDAVLEWIQNKYDAMGCTVAAMRLMSHQSISVQVNAACLIISMLQGGNKKIQDTMASYLSQSKNVEFFASVRRVLDSTADTLRDFKRVMKNLKAQASKAGVGSMSDVTAALMGGSGAGSGGGASNTPMADSGFGVLGKQSHCMFVLRLIQVMCDGQHSALQGMMSKQNGSVTYDITRRLLDLFELSQPLIQDALWLNSDTDLVGLGIQLSETIQSLVMGPNHTNIATLISSNFLAVANRIFSSIEYSEVSGIQQDPSATSNNDLKAWYKSAILKVCLALFEGVQDNDLPSQILEFFELKNIVSQLVAAGRLLGHVYEWERSSVEVSQGDLGDEDGVLGSIMKSKTGSMVLNQTNNAPKGRRAVFSSVAAGGNMRSTAASKRHKSQQEMLKFSAGWEETIANEMFGYFLLLVNFADYDNCHEARAALGQLKIDLPRLFNHLKLHTSSVEFVRIKLQGSDTDEIGSSSEPQVETVHFRVSDEIISLSRSRDFRFRTEEILFNVPRENPQEKAKAFLVRLDQCIKRTMWMQYLSHPKRRFRRFLVRNRETFDVLPLLLSLIITICLLCVYGIPTDPNDDDNLLAGGMFIPSPLRQREGYEDPLYPVGVASTNVNEDGLPLTYGSVIQWTDLSLEYRLSLKSRWMSDPEWRMWPAARVLVRILAVLHVVATVMNTFVNLIMDNPLLIFETLSTNTVDNHQNKTHSSSSDHEAAKKVYTGKQYLDHLPPVPGHPHIPFSWQLVTDLLKVSYFPLYFGSEMIVSLLGLVSSPFFFVFLMFDYLRRRDGRLVLQAIIVGGPNLLRSFAIGIIVLVVYGFYTYAYFSPSVIDSSDLCHSPFQCVAKHILDSMTGDLTTVLGDAGGNNWAFPAMAPWADVWETWRSLFVFSSIIFWVFLLQGIIQGQIIDAFAEMRSMEEAAHADLEQRCFISSIERFVFNEYPGEWEKRRGGQYAWHYLFYFLQLQDKGKANYNGIENQVSDCYAQIKTDFLPVGVSAAQYRESLEAGAATDLDTVAQGLQQLKGAVGQLSARMDEELQSVRHSIDRVVSLMLPVTSARPSFVSGQGSGGGLGGEGGGAGGVGVGVGGGGGGEG